MLSRFALFFLGGAMGVVVGVAASLLLRPTSALSFVSAPPVAAVEPSVDPAQPLISNSPPPERIPVTHEKAGDETEELRAEVDRLHRRLAALEPLAFQQSPYDALALAVEQPRNLVEVVAEGSYFIHGPDDLRLALLSVGAKEFWQMCLEETAWFRDQHDPRRKELDAWAFRAWVVPAAQQFSEDINRRGLPVALTANFCRIVAE